MMARIFIGVSLPDSIRARLAALPHTLDKAKWTRPDNLHLTLVFIGETAQVDAVASVLQAVKSAAFPLAVQGVGHFDGRILWAGIAPNDALHGLQQNISALLSAAGITFERRPFRPHVTLARLGKGQSKRELAAYLDEHDALESPAWTVDTFHLYVSQSTPEGVRYRPLRNYALAS